jgi:uncharacterized protein
MEQNKKKLRLATFLLSTLFTFCLVGCAWVTETREYPPVPPPEEQPAPTPEPPRAFPTPAGFVNDFANVLDDRSERELETRLSKFQQDQRVDFAIATVLSTGPELIDDYSLEMTREWKVGSENGGLLLLVSIDNRKWRIQIDRKLEALISNEDVGKIGELMVTDFKRKNYSAGIKKCVYAMISSLIKKLDNSRSKSDN